MALVNKKKEEVGMGVESEDKSETKSERRNSQLSYHGAVLERRLLITAIGGLDLICVEAFNC